MYKVAVASLGCSKNLVDSENMMGDLKCKGYELVNDESQAEVIIVNTCCFIEDAKLESIDVILDMAAHKETDCKALVVTGCMAQRYRDEILNEFPEVDCVAVIGSDICAAIQATMSGKREVAVESCPHTGERVLTTPPYMAYLKISEGCNNNCTYCVIPSIRGSLSSRKIEDIVDEAKRLVEGGVKELVVVAQDTTAYGLDIYGECKVVELVSELCKLPVDWIRLQYCYPERISDELIDLIAREQKICRYLDIPIQHCEDSVLTRMGRRGSKSELVALVEKLRQRIPDIVLRTTLIVGFPGETDEEFKSLCDFVTDMRFERLGVFAYSQEEGTPAAEMDGQIDPEVKKMRQESAMLAQDDVAEEYSESRVGSVAVVLVEGYDRMIKRYFGRSYADSPDVDGLIFFTGPKDVAAGTFVNVLIEEAIDYDLYGCVV